MLNARRVLIAVILLRMAYASPDAQTGEPDSLKPGDAAPKFVLPSLEGKSVYLRDYCGKLRKPWTNKQKYVIILSFFASWCKPCMHEIPILENTLSDYSDKPVKAFLINLKEDEDLVKKLIQEKKFRFPVLLDKYAVVAEKYGVDTLPRLFVIDFNGKLIWMTAGYDENFELRLKSTLNKLFGIESPPAQNSTRKLY